MVGWNKEMASFSLPPNPLKPSFCMFTTRVDFHKGRRLEMKGLRDHIIQFSHVADEKPEAQR